MGEHMGGNCRFLAREGHRQPIRGHMNIRFRNAVLQAGVVNSPDATADLLDQLHAVEHIEE